MQISKIAVVIGTFALTAAARADADNPDQAAARAALVSKLFDMSAASTVTNPTVAAPAMTAPAMNVPTVSTTTIVKPAVKADDVVLRPVNVDSSPAYAPIPRLNSGGNFRNFRSPHQEIQNPEMNWTRPYAASTAPAIKNSMTQPVVNSAGNTASVVTPRPMTGGSTKYSSPPSAPPMVKEFAPIVAPSLPLSATKQQRLQDLLAKYKADQITPEEYHRQRAAIINGM